MQIIATEIHWDDVRLLLSDDTETSIKVAMGPGYWGRVIREARARGIVCRASDFGSIVPKIVDEDAIWQETTQTWQSDHPLCVLA